MGLFKSDEAEGVPSLWLQNVFLLCKGIDEWYLPLKEYKDRSSWEQEEAN